MAEPGPNVSGGGSAFDAARASALVSEMRKVHLSGRTKSLQWRREQLQGIIRMTQENEEDILHALAQDLGKPRVEAWTGDINPTEGAAKLSLKNLEAWTKPTSVPTNLASFPGKSVMVPEPFGVVLVIAPWNYPYVLAMEPLIGALAAGNSVVVKPSEHAPATAALLVRLFPKYLDATAVQVVTGSVPEASALLQQRWDLIFFTGNPEVGKIVMEAAAKHLTPVILELGGKNPCIVDKDVDIEVTARRLGQGKLLNCGQTCIAPDYVLCEESVASVLTERLRKMLLEWYGENARKSTDLGKIVNERQFKRLDGYLSHPETASRIVCGGERQQSELFIAPTLLRDVPWDAPIMKNEIFGPILPIQTVRSVEEALEIVNARPKPLALYLFTNDKGIQERVIGQTSAGGVCVNDTLMHFTNKALPFGGVGESGMGAYHGKHSFEAFSHKKAVLYRSFGMDVDARFPPYTQRKESFLRALFSGDFLGVIMVLAGLRK